MNRSVRKYNLSEIHKHESDLQRYIRLTVGGNANLWILCWHECLLGVCTGLPGGLGILSRKIMYPSVFKGFNRSAFIGRHVTLRCPRQIFLSKRVIIDDFVQLIATSQETMAISVGQGSFVRSFVMINAGPPEGYVRIGCNTSIGQNSILYGNGGLTIGNNVLVAGQCFIVASSHNFDRLDIPIAQQGFTTKGITIEDSVWIGAGAKILDGVTIGEGAIVGANAVVNRSVAPGERVGGVPARSLIKIEEGDS